MGERSDYASGTFCFADVGTTDRPRAAEVGRTTVIEDPQGAVVALWEPGLHRGAVAGIFDWSYDPVDGSEPAYCEIRNREGWLNGGAMALPAGDVPPHWQVIFTVEDAQAATAGGSARRKRAGGADGHARRHVRGRGRPGRSGVPVFRGGRRPLDG